MGLFSRLFGGGADNRASADNPTGKWPPSRGPCPQVSLERGAIESFGGRLAFGEPLESASVFGRPDSFQAGKNHASLAYSAWGLTLEFELGRFIGATYEFEEGADDAPRTAFSAGGVKGPDGLALDRRTTKADVLRRFGEPWNTQAFDHQTVLYYKIGPLISEFQLNDEGRLFAWDVYLD